MKQLSDQSTAPIASAQTAAMDGPRQASARTTDAAQSAGDDGPAAERRARRRDRAREDAPATVGNPEVARIAALVVGSPEFQRQ